MQEDRQRPTAFKYALRATTPRSKKLIAALIEAIETTEEQQNLRQRQRKKSDQETFQIQIDCILSNLASNVIADKNEPVRVSRSHARIGKKSRYDTLTGQKTLPKVLDLLARDDIGLLTQDIPNPKLTFATLQTTIMPTAKLRELINRSGVTLEDFGLVQGNEIIVLRGQKIKQNTRGAKINYSETEQTIKMREDLTVINDWINDLEIELSPSLKREHNNNIRRLRRIFTRGDQEFKSGGRLFGGFWLNLPKTQRQTGLRLQGEEIITLDVESMNPTLLYSMAGDPIPQQDAYSIEGLENFRSGVKQVFNALTFRDKPLSRFPNGVRKEFPRRVSVANVVDGLLRKHSSIAHFFNTQIGHHLQFLESEIMVETLLLASANNLPALPVHDALIVPKSKAILGKELFKQAFEKVAGITPRISEE
jgi:hypothetical protein